MKVGLFFGTFNPIHIGHLALANFMAQQPEVDVVWLVVTPRNPFKKKDTLLDDRKRRDLVYEATLDNDRLKVSDVEFGLPQPNYTANTLAHLKERYPEHEFSLIMGADNLRSFRRWKNWEWILQHHQLLVYPRVLQPSEPAELDDETTWESEGNIRFYSEAPVIQISASAIRRELQSGRDARYMLTDAVRKYIEEMHFYE
jgi:nicotinate-nucleotide adenylyltransferase